jgi:hypothetical protein
MNTDPTRVSQHGKQRVKTLFWFGIQGGREILNAHFSTRLETLEKVVVHALRKFAKSQNKIEISANQFKHI